MTIVTQKVITALLVACPKCGNVHLVERPRREPLPYEITCPTCEYTGRPRERKFLFTKKKRWKHPRVFGVQSVRVIMRHNPGDKRN